MNEMQLTALLIGSVCLVIALYIMRSRSAARRKAVESEELREKAVSYDTGRDESQWRRAYSRG